MLDWLAPETCSSCSSPLRGTQCLRCPPLQLQSVEHPSPLIQQAYAGAPYHSRFGIDLKRAKYGHNLPLLQCLATQLATLATRAFPSSNIDYVVPVPSPWTRKLIRGFCPATVLALAVANQLNRPLCQALTLRPGARQAGLGQRARATNLTQRLVSRHPVDGTVLLVDDVLTTGTTSHFAAIELLGDASDRIHILTLCSVIMPACLPDRWPTPNTPTSSPNGDMR